MRLVVVAVTMISVMVLVMVVMVRVIVPVIDSDARMIMIVVWCLADRMIVVISVMVCMLANAYASGADINVLGRRGSGRNDRNAKSQSRWCQNLHLLRAPSSSCQKSNRLCRIMFHRKRLVPSRSGQKRAGAAYNAIRKVPLATTGNEAFSLVCQPPPGGG